jgi:hypothetical protein
MKASPSPHFTIGGKNSAKNQESALSRYWLIPRLSQLPGLQKAASGGRMSITPQAMIFFWN